MQPRSGRLLIGSILILIGLIALVSTVFHIRFADLCFPLALILIGLFLFYRPRWSVPAAGTSVFPIGDIRRSGAWDVKSEEMWTFVSDLDLDFCAANIPEGETTIRLGGFVTDIDLTLPYEVGVKVTASVFVMDSRIFGRKRDVFAASFDEMTPGYEEAPRRLNLEINGFVVDLTIERCAQAPSQPPVNAPDTGASA